MVSLAMAPPWVIRQPWMISFSLVEHEGLVFLVPVFIHHVEQVGRIHLAGVTGYEIGPVALADDGYAVDDDFLAGNRAFHVAAGLCGHIYYHAAGLHGVHHVGA